MTITAKIITDSTSPEDIRLPTMQLRYPHFIHAQFMSHRAFSRNASSSRAIPVRRLIQDIIDDTAMPTHWGMNQGGMQADEENNERVWYADHIDRSLMNSCPEVAWLEARDRAIEMARAYDNAGYHKQIVNRLLEPFSHINVIVTSTDWMNWFALRDHEDAQPEIKRLAKEIKWSLEASEPKLLQPGEWHLPYVSEEEIKDRIAPWLWENPVDCGLAPEEIEEAARRISTARCARVSYMTHDGQRPTIEADLKLYDHLMGGEIIHASAPEHQATPDIIDEDVLDRFGRAAYANSDLHGNFRGWIQFRKMIPGEAVNG